MTNPLDIPIIANWLGDTRVDLVRYIVFATGTWFLLWVVLARPMAGAKIRPGQVPPVRQLVREALFSVRSVAVYSTVGLGYVGLSQLGLLWGRPVAEALGPAWAVVAFLVMAVAHDAWFYWTHRIMHHPRLFRRFHRTHHLSHNPSPFTAYSFDVTEAVVQALFVLVFVTVFPIAPETVGLYVVFQIARNTIGHCGYELFPATRDGQRPLFDWMTTVTHHDLHHARAGTNYGLWFTWWDRWMGTEDPTYHARFAQVIARRRGQGAALAEGVQA
jgi:sterol desaturase/sphingolipid hydroxylase (fatty acid hydroxylase superfamily)